MAAEDRKPTDPVPPDPSLGVDPEATGWCTLPDPEGPGRWRHLHLTGAELTDDKTDLIADQFAESVLEAEGLLDGKSTKQSEPEEP